MYRQLDSECGVLFHSKENRRYFSGAACEEGLFAACGGGMIYVTDFRYAEIIERELAESDAELAVCTGADQLTAIYAFFVKHGVAKVLIEDEYLTLNQYRSLLQAMPRLQFGELGSLCEQIRAVKSEEEISYILGAQQIAEKAFAKLLHFIKPNVTERDVAAELEYQMKKLGAEGTSFDTIVASGVNSSVPHAVVSDLRILPGEFITIDFGAKYRGYCSDMTRTLFLGKPNKEERDFYQIVLKAQRTAIEHIRAGITGREADSYAREVIRANGYGEYFGHGLGHGVGLFIHEQPRVSPASEQVLLPNMVVTVEPGVYLKGKMGVRIEDMVVVEENGVRDLTATSAELIAL